MAALASDTKEADNESKDWYDMVTQVLNLFSALYIMRCIPEHLQGKKASALMSSSTEETLTQLASLALSDPLKPEPSLGQPGVTVQLEAAVISPARDSAEAVAAVVANTVTPSEQGKYPTREAREVARVCLPGLNPEVLRTAAERHRQAQMSPYLHQVTDRTGSFLHVDYFPCLFSC